MSAPPLTNRAKAYWAFPGAVHHDIIEQDGITLGSLALTKLSTDVHALCWVWSVRSYFYYDRLSLAPDDGITVVRRFQAAASQPGRWVRFGLADAVWQNQTTWYYDATNGHQEFPGTQLQPISLMAELFRRTYGPILTPVTLNIVGGAAALADPEAAVLDVLTAGPRQWTVVDI